MRKNVTNQQSPKPSRAALGSAKRVWLSKNPELYRAVLNCKIGRDALDGKTKPPHGCSPTDYALFCLLHAIEDIATHLSPNDPSSATGLGDKHQKQNE